MELRLAESEAKFKVAEHEHADKLSALNAQMEEASKRAKQQASRTDASAFTLEILELRWLALRFTRGNITLIPCSFQTRFGVAYRQKHRAVEAGTPVWRGFTTNNPFCFLFVDPVVALQMESLALRISDLEESQSKGAAILLIALFELAFQRFPQRRKNCLSWRTSSKLPNSRRKY